MASVEGYNYKPDIIELRQLHNPPQPVKNTLEAVCLLLGHSESESKDWRFVRNLLRSNQLADQLRQNDVKTRSPEIVAKAKSIHDTISVEQMKNCSKAAVSFYDWNNRFLHILVHLDDCCDIVPKGEPCDN